MAKASATPSAAKTAAKTPAKPHVAVVGGGLAGLTAALKLTKSGFRVSLYEASNVLGGNLSSSEKNGVAHDVYPHMFCDWYANFWSLLEDDLGLKREANFDPRGGVKLLDKGAKTFIELENATTPATIAHNLFSGLAPFPDLFLYGFSMLDLAATPFDRRGANQLEKLDVNGFVYSRGYSTEKLAELQNYVLMTIWSIQSDLTAASSYQDFIKHTLAFPHPTPFSWLLKGSLSTRLIAPLERKLKALGCTIHMQSPVTGVALDASGRPSLSIKGGAASRFDFAVMAAPAPALAKLAMNGPVGSRIVDKLPQLSRLARLRGEAIPVLDLYFKRKLKPGKGQPDIPREQFALGGTGCDMTVLDLSQLWTGADAIKDVTALAVAASDRYGLVAANDDEMAWRMIQDLHAYLPIFEPGAGMRDPSSDIDWKKTAFRSNEGNKLFINEVGSWELRPVAAYPEALPHVAFAGDYCQTDVDMATVESAVQSGILAARAVQSADRKRTGQLRGPVLSTCEHEVYSDAHFLAAKLLLLPLAYGATALSAFMNKDPADGAGGQTTDAYSTRAYTLLLPLAFSLDWWKTGGWLARRLLAGETLGITAEGGTGQPKADKPKSAEARLQLLGKWLDDSVRLTKPPKAKAGSALAHAYARFAVQLARTAESALYDAQPGDGGGYRRRWRMKH